MTITGYRSNADFLAAQKSVIKHLGLSTKDAKVLVENIKEGRSFRVTDDFVLREDLEDYGFIVE